MGAAHCPRCPREVGSDGHSWRCAVHGVVEPLAPATLYGPRELAQALELRPPPAWAPWPLPAGWTLTGMRWAGQARARAMAVACGGPGLLGGAAHLLLVAEEPGVGLGARYAGLTAPDPGPELAAAPHDAKVAAAGWPTPVWCVGAGPADRATYVGEARGCWLWLVVWPESEWMMVHDDLNLVDVLDTSLAYEIPAGGLLHGPLID